MQTNRRSVLRASGAAALLSVTGLAGCSGILGGGGGSASDYQYDPGTILETRNKLFGTVDYAQLYEARENLPESAQESFEGSENSPVNPEDLDTMTGVAGARVSISDSGSATVFGSAAILGSFDQAAIEENIQSEGDTEQTGEYEGFTLYESTNTSPSVGSLPENTTASVGVTEGVMIIGAGSSQGEGTESVSGRQTVETMIDAGNGNAKRLLDNSEYAGQLNDRLGGSTMMIGGQVDPALVEALTGMSGGGMQGQFANGIRAGGFGMALNGETTTVTVVGIYQDASTAEDTGIVEIVDRFSQSAVDQNPALNSVSANYDGSSVVITIEGDTQTLFEQGSSMGGSGFDVARPPASQS